MQHFQQLEQTLVQKAKWKKPLNFDESDKKHLYAVKLLEFEINLNIQLQLFAWYWSIYSPFIHQGDQNVKGILKKPSSVTFSNDVPQGIQANQAGVYIPMSQLPFIQNPNLSNQSNFQLQQPIRNLLDENFSQKSNNK